MNELNDPYIQKLNICLHKIHPGIFSSIDKIGSLDANVVHETLAELVKAACQATNDSTIVAARAAIVSIPKDILDAKLAFVANESLNLDDEWEFRRLLELLKIAQPSMMAQFVERGLSSTAPDVIEAARLYASGFHGRVEGLGG